MSFFWVFFILFTFYFRIRVALIKIKIRKKNCQARNINKFELKIWNLWKFVELWIVAWHEIWIAPHWPWGPGLQPCIKKLVEIQSWKFYFFWRFLILERGGGVFLTWNRFFEGWWKFFERKVKIPSIYNFLNVNSCLNNK